MPPLTPDTMPSLLVEGLSKAYGGVRAVQDVTIRCFAGEVHAFIGENGAGKSTAVKILSGSVRRDAGSIVLDGVDLRLRRPRDATAAGIATVHQELSLIPHLTVGQNLLFGREPRDKLGRIHPAGTATSARSILDEHGVAGLDVTQPAGTLSVAERQSVEIVKAFSSRPTVLILDEPTSALGPSEVEWLFAKVRTFAAGGGTAIFITHRLDEVSQHSDRITVMRNGVDVGAGPTREFDQARLVDMMLGRSMERLYPVTRAAGQAHGGLRTEALTSGRLLRGVTLDAPRGAVTGVAALAGQGQKQLFDCLLGLSGHSGRIWLDDTDFGPTNPGRAIAAGVSLVPEDRGAEGLCLPLSIRHNITLGSLRRISTAGIVGRTRERALVQRLVEQLRVTPRDTEVPVGDLSGGNQQKVLLARVLAQDPALLLMYDPTRGVDVGTKFEIYALMRALADDGRAVLFYSTDAAELAHVSDAVWVLHDGAVAGRYTGDELVERALVAAMVGARADIAAVADPRLDRTSDRETP